MHKAHPWLAALLGFAAGACICFLCLRLVPRSVPALPETTPEPRYQSSIQCAADLDEILHVSFPKTNPIISVQMDHVSFFLFHYPDADWGGVEEQMLSMDGMMPIENGLMSQMHEDAFDQINAQVMAYTGIEYWPTVMQGYSLLRNPAGEALTQDQLPDPFTGSFILLDTEKKQMCIYLIEEQ